MLLKNLENSAIIKIGKIKDKYIEKSIKKFFIKILAYFLRGLILLEKALLLFYFKIVKKPLKIAGKIIFYVFILSFYKLYLWLKKQLAFLGITGGRLVAPFARKNYLIHLVIIAMAVMVVANNRTYVFASEPSGGDNILSGLISEDNGESDVIIEESGMAQDAVIKSYQEQVAVLKAVPQADEEDMGESAIIVQDGTALVKPNIPTMLGGRTRNAIEYYNIQQGDTISTIAAQFGVSIDTILWENNLGPFDYIRPGQKLTILPTTGVSHKVKSGDTVEKIAKKYNVDADQILEFNKLYDSSSIALGQVLVVPGGRIIYNVPAPKTQIAPVKTIFTGPIAGSSSLAMIWPTTTHRISQYYSWRHTGLDINGDFGDPIWASADGIVEASYCTRWDYGCRIIIDHGGGKKTLYGHAQKLLVKVGQSVKKGQLIMEEGSTGRSTGSHLHFEVRVNGRRMNPLSYIK
jgi:murein DD-endopeptidase MepM/ murein hydrolase activator NlpD